MSAKTIKILTKIYKYRHDACAPKVASGFWKRKVAVPFNAVLLIIGFLLIFFTLTKYKIIINKITNYTQIFIFSITYHEI